MREIRPSGSEGGARSYPLSLPLSQQRSQRSSEFARLGGSRVQCAVLADGQSLQTATMRRTRLLPFFAKMAE